jgi:lysophospholipase L1-like esterase
MLECLIIGDSIGVGTHHFRKECVAYAKSGWNTSQWNHDYLMNDLTAQTVIISLGSNDLKHMNTREELQKTRAKVKGHRVFWILPAIKPHIQQIVRDIAKEHNDTVLEISNLQADKIHPSFQGYKELAEKTK